MSAGSSNHGGPSATVSAVSTPINAGSRPDSAPALGSSQASTPPNSGTKFLDVKAQEDKKSRRTSLQMLLPKLPSSDSAGPSPGPSSPDESPGFRTCVMLSWVWVLPLLQGLIPGQGSFGQPIII
uniref:Uncharacterized protein n=1 Tax=Anopheles albimanus TaxID=7167 RepID=A0A182FB01_ANOAL